MGPRKGSRAPGKYNRGNTPKTEAASKEAEKRKKIKNW